MSPIIEISGLAKRYPGSAEPAVKGVSLSGEKGEVFGLLGPNGAGKTTLISMLTGLITPSAGSARIAGYNLHDDPLSVKRLIGIVPQDLALYPSLSMRENFACFGALYGLGGRRLRHQVDRALDRVGLKERANDRIETLSGGMKRRANIAAGLLHEPPILFLDEPTVGVDPQSRNFIFEGVAALRRGGATVVYTTHYMEEAERLCDRVAIIDRGAVIALDTPQAMIRTHGGSVVIEIDGDAARACAALERLDGVSKVTCAGSRITIAAAAPTRVLSHIVGTIADTEAEIRSMNIFTENLESVFLDLTGRQLRG